jgi:hypothetical protein
MNSSSVPLAMNDDRRTASASSSPIITNTYTTSTTNDNAVTAGVVQVQAVSNPYALKKSGPQLSMKPLHEAATKTPATTAAVLEAPAATTAALSANANEAADFSLSRASSDKPHFSDEKYDIIQDRRTSPISEKEATTTTTAAAIATVSTSGGIHLPMWQRLPSRNLSFQSAEILTVTECLQHFPLYAERSVRVTGSILEKFVHSVADHSNDNMNNSNSNDNMNMVSLVLSDPLAALPTSRSAALRRRSTSLGGNTNRRVSFPKTPSSTLNKIQQTGTGNTTSVTKRTPGTHTILRRKSGGLLGGGDGAAGTPGLASSRKRRSSGAFKATNPEDVLVQTLASSSLSSTNCLWVLANPQHVSVTHSTTGDLVMAMGEIREYKLEDSDLPSTIHTIAARIRAAQQQQQPGRQTSVTGQAEEPENKQQQEHQYRPIYFLQTRILRNANGTNMKLHTEALYARRQQLVAARSRSRQPCSISVDSAAADQRDASASSVWHGCGPPPYNINDSKSS